MLTDDTIVAISTPWGRSGIGVVRLSGVDALEIACHFLRRRDLPTQESLIKAVAGIPQQAVLAAVIDPQDGELIDQAVVIFFKGPRSYTGEDVVEISCHGSPVVLEHVLHLAMGFGARLAEPGEFTFRAFFHGHMDLIQAEAVHDLIEAKTLYQARIAIQQAQGSLSKTLAPLKGQLIDLIALMEAGIDFAEDDVSVPDNGVLISRLEKLLRSVDPVLESYAHGRIIHEGLSLAIIGRPNVGKSSLFNRLLAMERAIVTDIPGTTRDLISETAQIHGIPVRLVDTAGIRGGSDLVEQEGVTRSYSALAESDLVLLVLDTSDPWNADDLGLLEQVRPLKHLVVLNKCDLEPRIHIPEAIEAEHVMVRVSAKTEEGIPQLKDIISRKVTDHPGGEFSSCVTLTNLRHHQLLTEGRSFLESARKALQDLQPHEMVLLNLYGALRSFDSMTGETTVEDILGNIFSSFCVGK